MPVLLLQGTGFALDVWRPHPVHDLAARHRVITLDPRGIGRSTYPDQVLTIAQIAADIAELLDHLAVEPAHVVGHSMGGKNRTRIRAYLSGPRPLADNGGERIGSRGEDR